MRLNLLAASAAFSVLAVGLARAAPPIEAFGHLPGIESMTLSPNGERVAFIGVNGDARKVFIRQFDGPMLMQDPVGEAKVRSLVWAGNDHLLIFSTETAGMSSEQDEKGEYETLVVANLRTGKAGVPLRDSGFFPGIEGIYGIRQVNGRWYGYFGLQRTKGPISLGRESNYTKQNGAELYRIDLDSLEIQLVAHSTKLPRSWALDENGRIAAIEEYDSEAGEGRIYSGEGGGAPLARVKSDSDSLGVAGLGRTPGSILVEGLHGEGHSPQELDLKTGKVSDILPDADDNLSPIHDTTTHLLEGYSLGGEHPKVVMFDPGKNLALERAMRPFHDARAVLLGVNQNYDRFLVHTEGDTDSGTYYLVDLKAHKADPLGYDYPPVGGNDVGPRRVVHYKAADGTALEGFLTLPSGRAPKNLPVIVLPHGGPRAHDSIGFDWWSQAFAARGYAVFQPQFRGSTGYGEALIKAGYGEWGKKMQTDITDGLKAIIDDGTVDPKRACVMGASYGGYAALASVTVQHGFYRCAVSVAGVSDLNAMLNWELSKAGYMANSASRYWNVAMGARSADDPAMQPISPDRLAAKADAPILLVYGRDDTVVPNEQSVRMERALKAAGKPVEVVVMDKEDHWLSREASRIQMLKVADAFIEKYNPPDAPKGVVTVEPSKATGH